MMTMEKYVERYSKEFNEQNKLRHWLFAEGYPTATVVYDVYGGDESRKVIVNPLALEQLCEDEYAYECLYEDELTKEDYWFMPFKSNTMFDEGINYSPNGVMSFKGTAYATHQLKFDEGVLQG